MGRPPKYETPEAINEAIDEYFSKIKEDNGRPTITGLAYYLGFESRQSMYDYKERDEFSYSIKRAILYIESIHEANLFGNSATGSIFWLKNRDWRDKIETEHSGSLNISKIERKIIDPSDE